MATIKSIKQKAKAYDKALEKARQLCAYPTSKPFISDLQDLFPELRESEDERIRKFLIQMAQNGHGEDKDWWNKCVAWLEKQQKPYVEQKPIKEHNICNTCEEKASCVIPCPMKLVEQKPAEWSEEDESRIITICTYLQDYARLSGSELRTIRINEYCDWLKSLKERYAWMPSDKQMEAVRLAAEIGTANNSWAMNILKSMYQDLQKLREE